MGELEGKDHATRGFMLSVWNLLVTRSRALLVANRIQDRRLGHIRCKTGLKISGRFCGILDMCMAQCC